MVGPTAQIVSLALHLNARARHLSTPPFRNSTTQFCELIRFLHKTQPPNPAAPDPDWHLIADSPDQWLDTQGPARRALVIHEPTNDPRLSDRMSSGFVGGGSRWFLCVDGGQSFECWEAWWKVGNQQAADRRIWHVHYARVVESYILDAAELAAAIRPLDAVASHLRDILARIEEFAFSRNLAHFGEAFQKSSRCFGEPEPLSHVFHNDIAPPGTLSLAAAQVLAACQAAWVFGGMGSWNDLIMEGDAKATYESLSDELFNAINHAIVAAANSAAP